VNRNEIDDKNIINHFKPTMIKDYETILSGYDDLMRNEKDFEQIKSLYKKWWHRLNEERLMDRDAES
jgi:hypothetical protein